VWRAHNSRGSGIAVSSQAALKAQISALSTSQSSSSTEVDNLKRRVDDTEREKRDLVGVISRLKQDSSQREGMLRKPVEFTRF
jgi:nucleoprotein TPR